MRLVIGPEGGFSFWSGKPLTIRISMNQRVRNIGIDPALVFLHEVGHAHCLRYHGERHLYDNCDLYQPGRKRIAREACAWKWAVRHILSMRGRLTDREKRQIRAAFSTFVRRRED